GGASRETASGPCPQPPAPLAVSRALPPRAPPRRSALSLHDRTRRPALAPQPLPLPAHLAQPEGAQLELRAQAAEHQRLFAVGAVLEGAGDVIGALAL